MRSRIYLASVLNEVLMSRLMMERADVCKCVLESKVKISMPSPAPLGDVVLIVLFVV